MSMRLWLAVLCGYFALGATIQALPSVVAGGPGTIGLLVTLAAAATAITRPFAGRLADRGRALPVARVGAALVAVGAAAHLVADTPVALALARLTIGAGEGALFTGALARVLEAAAVTRRGRLIGHFGLSMWGGLTLGPVVAATMSPRGALWLAATMGAAALALTAARLATPGRVGAPRARLAAPAPEVTPPARLATPGRVVAPPARAAARPSLIPRAAWRPGLVLGLASFGYGTVIAFAVLEAGSGALGVFAGAFLVVRLLGSRLVDDLGPRTVLVASAVLEAGALATVGVAGLVSLAAAGAALALVFPALALWVVEAAGERERGAAVGAMTSCWDVGIAAAGPVGALLVSPGHLAPAFIAASGLAALAAVGATPERTREFPDLGRAARQQDAAP